VDQQANFCKDWAKLHGHEVIWTVKDKESGRKDLFKREKFNKIIKTINGTADPKDRYNFLDNCDAVLVFKIDRITRNWYDQNEIENSFANSRINLLSAHEPIDLHSATGRMLFRLFSNLATYEVENMLERQAPGIADAKAKGKFKGRPKGSKNKK